MALDKNRKRLGTYTFEHEGSTLKLRSSLGNIESLESATGKEFHEYITECKTRGDLTTLFFHMQYPDDGEQIETRDDIYEAFFADVMALAKPEFQTKLQEMTFVLLGVDYQEALAMLPSDDLGDNKKKPAA